MTLSNDLPDGLGGTVTFGMDSMVSKLGNSRFFNDRGIPGGTRNGKHTKNYGKIHHV